MRFVSKDELRRLFNEREYDKRVAEGTLVAQIAEEHHPSPPLANEPPCTRSQAIRYVDPEDRPLAVAHRYLRPDGTIGLSGKPDPTVLYEPDEILRPIPPEKAGAG